MTLAPIAAVRLKTADRSSVTREKADASGEDRFYKLQHDPILTSPAPEVRRNGSIQTEGVNYTIDYTYGIVDFGSAITVGHELEFTYYWSVFSDAEIQHFLDEASGDTTIAASRVLLAWAADAAKLAKRQTLSGGGGLGQIVIDTSVAAKELRETAKALISIEKELGESLPAEGLTEIPWNEFSYEQSLEQHLIREN